MTKEIKKNNNITSFRYLVGLAALIILSISAYFSIRGISQLFSGQRQTAIALAFSLEFAKIIVTTLLTRQWNNINKLMRTYFIIATVILIVISSAGIFSNLTDAYQVTTLKTQAIELQNNTLQQQNDNLQQQKQQLQQDNKNIDEEIAIIRESIARNDKQVNKLYQQMEQDSTANWIESIWEFKKQNNDYKNTINKLRQQKQQNNVTISNINQQLQVIWNNMAQSLTSNKQRDVGPLKKLAELFNIKMDVLAKYFIFLIVLIFDPLGVLLIVAFNWMSIIKQAQPLQKNHSIAKTALPATPVTKAKKKKFIKNKENIIKDNKVDMNERDNLTADNIIKNNKKHSKNRQHIIYTKK